MTNPTDRPAGLRTELPVPLSRRGPRPLLLHLTLAAMRPGGFMSALPSWNLAFQHLNSGAANPREAVSPDPEVLKQAFETAARQDRDLVSGIADYRRDPYFRSLADPPLLWAEAETRLLDFGGSAAAGPAVLFVPSLINRSYILDLLPDDSMLRWLAHHGVHPYLLDWGWPAETERNFTLTDYIAGRLERAAAQIPGPIVLAGYCMGGLLALAAALRQPAKIKALALLATPWDFHAADPKQARRLSDTLPMLEPMMKFSGTLSIDALQTLFTLIDPFGVGEKYRSFAQLDKSSARARRFVAMEDWLADGVPPESARPLAAAFKNTTTIEPAAGHIGMIAGTHAQEALWQPFANWLHGLS
jgi:polyhydroxyalkanoate synthase